MDTKPFLWNNYDHKYPPGPCLPTTVAGEGGCGALPSPHQASWNYPHHAQYSIGDTRPHMEASFHADYTRLSQYTPEGIYATHPHPGE